jgi:hypothetical protein
MSILGLRHQGGSFRENPTAEVVLKILNMVLFYMLEKGIKIKLSRFSHSVKTAYEGDLIGFALQAVGGRNIRWIAAANHTYLYSPEH